MICEDIIVYILETLESDDFFGLRELKRLRTVCKSWEKLIRNLRMKLIRRIVIRKWKDYITCGKYGKTYLTSREAYEETHVVPWYICHIMRSEWKFDKPYDKMRIPWFWEIADGSYTPSRQEYIGNNTYRYSLLKAVGQICDGILVRGKNITKITFGSGRSSEEMNKWTYRTLRKDLVVIYFPFFYPLLHIGFTSSLNCDITATNVSSVELHYGDVGGGGCITTWYLLNHYPIDVKVEVDKIVRCCRHYGMRAIGPPYTDRYNYPSGGYDYLKNRNNHRSEFYPAIEGENVIVVHDAKTDIPIARFNNRFHLMSCFHSYRSNDYLEKLYEKDILHKHWNVKEMTQGEASKLQLTEEDTCDFISLYTAKFGQYLYDDDCMRIVN